MYVQSIITRSSYDPLQILKIILQIEQLKKEEKAQSSINPNNILLQLALCRKNDHQYYKQTYPKLLLPLSLMLSTFPAKLEIVSLSLREGSAYDLICSISLMKGMQNFGERKFQIQKDQTQYAFGENKLFKFFYTPRLNTRRDVFFRLILTDLQSSEQLGDIPISTHKLIKVFEEDPQAIIEQSADFFQGVTLHYRIYQPYHQLGSLEPISGFRTQGKANYVENIISRPEQQNVLLKSSHLKKSTLEIKKEVGPKSNGVGLLNPMKLESLNSSNKEEIIKQGENKEQQQKKENIFASLLGKPEVSDNANPKRERRNSGQIPDQNMIMSKIFRQVRKVGYQEQKKRHTLSSQEPHEDNHGLSKKMKTVIILIIFGLIMLVNDFVNDQRGKKVGKKTKKPKAKKKVNEL